jgi:Leucine-rich repeat (LRR) protein
LPTETELLHKFKDILKISQEVKQSQVAKSLKLSEEELFEFLLKWGHLGFKLKNDLIVVDDLNSFMSELDAQFAEWGSSEKTKEGKRDTFPIASSLSPAITDVSPPSLSPHLPAIRPYHGTPLIAEDYEVMMILERTLGTAIPMSPEVQWNSFGFVSLENRVVHLGIYMKKLQLLPETFGNLTALKTLYLARNLFIGLPETFGNLIFLQRLELWGNRIESLPENFGNLAALQSLILGSNKIQSLPESFESLTALTVLDLQGNPMKNLPEKNKQILRKFKQNGCRILGIRL